MSTAAAITSSMPALPESFLQSQAGGLRQDPPPTQGAGPPPTASARHPPPGGTAHGWHRVTPRWGHHHRQHPETPARPSNKKAPVKKPNFGKNEETARGACLRLLGSPAGRAGAGQSPRCCRPRGSRSPPGPRAAKVLLWRPAAQRKITRSARSRRRAGGVAVAVLLPVARHGDVRRVQRQAPLQPRVQHPQHRLPPGQRLRQTGQPAPGPRRQPPAAAGERSLRERRERGRGGDLLSAGSRRDRGGEEEEEEAAGVRGAGSARAGRAGCAPPGVDPRWIPPGLLAALPSTSSALAASGSHPRRIPRGSSRDVRSARRPDTLLAGRLQGGSTHAPCAGTKRIPR